MTTTMAASTRLTRKASFAILALIVIVFDRNRLTRLANGRAALARICPVSDVRWLGPPANDWIGAGASLVGRRAFNVVTVVTAITASSRLRSHYLAATP
jgi:hypothetical protein